MRFSKEMEQALRSLGYLYRNKGLVSARELSDDQGIPFEKLSKVLQKLAAAKIIQAHRGRQGGYSLSQRLEDLKLYDLRLILDDVAKVVPCLTGKPCLSQNKCSIITGMDSFQKELDKLLSRFSAFDFIEGVLND